MNETAMRLLADLQARGFSLRNDGGVLEVWPGDKLTDDDCQMIRLHKPALLALVGGEADGRRFSDPVPILGKNAANGENGETETGETWDAAEAEVLVSRVLPSWNAPDRPLSLNPLGATVDAAWDALDLTGLRAAVSELLAALAAVGST
jgi:hypothetical protein